MVRCKCCPGSQENCQSEGSSVSTHMSFYSLRDLKSRPGTRRVFSHLSLRLPTSAPTFLHQILLWVLYCGSIFSCVALYNFLCLPCEIKSSLTISSFQCMDRLWTDISWDFSRTSSACQYHFTLGPYTHAVQQTCLWDPEGCR